MTAQLQITVRDMPHSDALDERARRYVAALDRLNPRATSCHVTVEAPHQHHKQGNHFTVKLDVRFPGGEITVNRDHTEDAHIALKEAFQAARRQLVAHARRGQGAEKRRRAQRGAAGAATDE